MHRVTRAGPMTAAGVLFAALLTLPAPAPAGAQSDAPAAAPTAGRGPIHPWEYLDDSLRASFSGSAFAWYGAAAATTPPLVFFADRPVQDVFQRHDPLGDITGQLALYLGGSLPAALPLGLYLGGLAGSNAELATAGAAALQAGAIQLVVVSALKWLTDRAGPFPDGDVEAERWHATVLRDSDDPRDFDFDPFNLRWGLRWPSGHTASTIAMASALVAFYPDEAWLPWLVYPFALAVGVGMIEGDYHWLSDVTAGALTGHVIGWRVGRTFRERFEQGIPRRSAATTGVAFRLGAGTIQVQGQF